MKKQLISYVFLGFILFVVCFGAGLIINAVANQPPVLDFMGNQTVNEGELLQFTVHATDPDLDSLTYSATGLPRGAAFDPATGKFSWIPDYNQSGKPSPLITFNVTDKKSGSATQSVVINVNNVEPSELIQNPGFDTGIDDWHCVCLENTTASAAISWYRANYDTAPASLQVQCADNGGTYTDIQLLTSQLNLVKDTTYLLTFKAKSSGSFTIHSIKLNQAGSPWSDYASPFRGLNVTTAWQDYAALFTANATVSDARLTFFLGNSIPDGATLNIDSVSLKKTIVYAHTGTELLPNPDFDKGVTNWNLSCDFSAQAYRYLDATDYDTAPVSYKIQCIDSGNTLNSVQLFTMPISITAGKSYLLTFRAKCDSIFAIPSIRLMKATSPWTNYASPYSGLTITSDWQSYSIRFTANTTGTDGRITFFLGNALSYGATFKIDSVSLREEGGAPNLITTPTVSPSPTPTYSTPTPIHPIWQWASEYTPPYHIMADEIGDLWI
ncbi:MAG TPA: carbohydrate binding domain-containing protein [Bacillota bacterium]|nr:carbohydrate binding domain-containing protein [Bacillota bacterium]